MGQRHYVLDLSTAIITIILFVFLASCSDSSSGGHKPTSPAEERLDVYAFDLSDMNTDPLLIYYSALKKSVEVKEGSTGVFNGTYAPKTGAYAINRLSAISVSATLWDDLSNTFYVEVKDAVRSSGGEYPEEGTLRIIDRRANLITVTLSSKSVSLTYNTSSSITLSWTEFLNLTGSPAETWKQQASLAWSVMTFVTSQIDMAMDCAISIQDNRDTLVQSAEHKLTVPCGVLPGQDQGIRSLQWDDANGNNTPGTGDDFLLTLGNCWENDLDTRVDTLLFGPVHLLDYVEETKTEGNTMLLTKTGFGVAFDGLTISETVESPSGTFTIDPARTRVLDGGFSLTLYEPTE